MNTLREAAGEYLSLRRRLGYTLDRSGWALLQFVSFMERPLGVERAAGLIAHYEAAVVKLARGG